MLSEINFQTNQVNHLQEQIITLQAKITSLENLKKDQLSIAIVSGDMDKILAAMVISLGAAALDTHVKLFFSFWSLSALRDTKKKAVGKDFISKMFGLMLPEGRNKLRLSNMNMAGLGPLMIRYLMKKQGVLSLDQMFKEAGDLGIEEMIDYPNLRYAGAVTFVSEANESSMQLFI